MSRGGSARNGSDGSFKLNPFHLKAGEPHPEEWTLVGVHKMEKREAFHSWYVDLQANILSCAKQIMVIVTKDMEELHIKKKMLKDGNGKKPTFGVGAKATFHFKTYICNEQDESRVILDDSKDFGKPFELLIGRSFKLNCWEECVKSMLHGEVSTFSCPVKTVIDYPSVSRSLRDLHHGKEQQAHSCGLHAAQEGLGYEDLNTLQQNMKPLEFEFELLKVEEANTYEKELWQMNPEEMRSSVPRYHEEGNALFKDGKIEEAEKKYANAIGCLKHLQMKERPGTDLWVTLDKEQIPLLLNYAQCKLMQGESTVCINHCTEVLEKIDGHNNVKALFKRGKAHALILNEKESIADFQLALKLDPTIQSAVRREIASLQRRQKERDGELSKHLKGMFKDK